MKSSQSVLGVPARSRRTVLPLARGREPKKRGRMPRLNAEERLTLRKFLAFYEGAAKAALEFARGAWRDRPDNTAAHGQYLYWQHVISCLRWLQSRVDCGQRYLREDGR